MPIIDDVRERIVKIFPPSKSFPPSPRRRGSGYIEGAGGVHDDMILSKPAIVFHSAQAFFAFLAMASFASVAAFQAKWGVGPSGLSGFAIFVSVTDLLLSLFLLAIPVIYDKYDKFNRLARALKEDRVAFILVGYGTITMLFIAFITTISAFTEPGCKDPSKDPNASLGDDFKNGLSGWCDTKKAGSIFFWLAAIFWVCSAYLTFRDWRTGKSERERTRNQARDPPFTHPDDPSGYAPSIRDGYSAADAEAGEGGYDDRDRDAEYGRTERYSGSAPQLPPLRQQSSGLTSGVSNPTSPFSDANRVPAAPRQSIDAYGAFSDPEPTGYNPSSPGVSRTMQYADPYAAVTATLNRASASPSPEPALAAFPVPQTRADGPPQYDYTGYSR